MKKTKTYAALLFLFINSYSFSVAAWEASEVQDCPVNKRNSAWLDCVPEDTPAKLPYKMQDGTVKVLHTRGTAFCIQGICEYQNQRDSGLWDSTQEYAGKIQQIKRTPIV